MQIAQGGKVLWCEKLNCDSLESIRGQMIDLLVGHFTLKNAELHCNPPLCGSPPPPTLHPYISACGVDNKTI